MTREEEIRARLEEVAPAPWRVVDANEGDPPEYGQLWVVCSPDASDDSDWFAELRVGWKQDAEFIAHAREDVPYLLDENARLRAEPVARVMTLEEVKRERAVWVEVNLLVGELRPIRPDVLESYYDCEYTFFTSLRDYQEADYGTKWRCWSMKPTDAQRAAAKWEA